MAWFAEHQRPLPWRRTREPYAIWVSEVMLQQTQVNTVIPYYRAFMRRFPDVQRLAAADLQEVLKVWEGMGYYARARNLHRAAGMVCSEFAGKFPATVDALCALPGIGRSTAGAIVSIAFGRPAVILDGNVKRVLARYRAVEGWPGQALVHQRLWQLAQDYTPAQRSADYSQAMMDLGATVCTRAAPACERCPLGADCQARQTGTQLSFPGKKPRKTLPVKATTFVMATAGNGDIWLERRPPAGIWGGLWCFPEITDAQDAGNWCLDRFGLEPAAIEAWDGFRHTFSHYHLDIRPVRVLLGASPGAVMANSDRLWYNQLQPPQIGLAAPVATLLAKLAG